MGFLSDLFGGGAADAGKEARRQAAREAREREAAITQGTTKVRNTFDRTFTNDFYEGLRSALENYYLPQVQTQYEDAQKSSLYSLDRQGLRESSVRGDAFGKLQGRFDQAKQDVVRKGQGLVDTRKNEVARALENAVMQINASEDPISAANLSAANAQVMAYAPEYQPLGQVFTDLTNALAIQSRLEDQGRNRYQTPSWLSWATSSGRSKN